MHRDCCGMPTQPPKMCSTSNTRQTQNMTQPVIENHRNSRSILLV
jgi:hypothetical protein